ncbi:hypothetical protein J5U18_11755 [Sphingobacteriaceae bacterium WQ 2009]|uniref:CarboxypepD_reg-like domain-containing protein n=1 Tax=Rhinopithecimicrobium faecis TaxID=2820698 RepID=A0A8T4HAT4_9SPHI|nr:hypothetical protein [Sphingobacteriaceae bacterium WQ 2009]
MKTSYYILFLLFFCRTAAVAQEVEGIVFDKRTKQRIAQVMIHNINTGISVFNNTRGEFTLKAAQGDILITAVKGYFPDTIRIANEPVLMVALNRESIYIDEVSVIAKQSPEEILKKRQEEYEKAFRLSSSGDAFSIGANGAGLSVDWLYGLFSKERKNAKRLRTWIENDYKEDIIDAKFTKELVIKTTGLSGEQLLNFMHTFRPSYDFILTANDYQLTQYIKNKLIQYKRNPNRFRIEPLPKISLDVNN